MKKINGALILSAILVTLPSTSIFADTLEGYIRSSGGGVNYRTTIIDAKTQKGTKLCPVELAKKINKYQRVLGQIKGTQGKNCFEPVSFTLLKMPSGQDPLTGVLEKKSEDYYLKSKSKTYKLYRIPKVLETMVGKNLVVDLKKPTNPKHAGDHYLVKYFAIAP